MAIKEPWKVIRSETDEQGRSIELRYAEFGKGKSKVRYWRIYRDGEYAGYASVPEDVDVNFARVMSGFVLNASTGNYEQVK